MEEGLLLCWQVGALMGACTGGGYAYGAGFWHLGQAVWVARRGAPASAKAWGKALTVEPPLPEMDEELPWWLQQEEVVEEAWLGQDTTTLKVVREAASLLMWGQLEGLEGPS